MISHDIPFKITEAVELGEVVEEVEQKQFIGLSELAVVWVVAFGLLWLFSSGLVESFWGALGLAIAASVVVVAFTVANRSFDQSKKRILRIHEHGVSVVESGEFAKIHFDQVDELGFKKTLYSFSESVQQLELKSGSGDGQQSIKWIADNLKGVNFDELHLRISKRVTQRMAATVEANQRVAWGESNFICDNGIEVNEKTGFFKSEMRFVPWSELKDMMFRDGRLMLSFESGKWDFAIPCSEPNLLAGYQLVDRQMKGLYGDDWMPSR